MRRTVAGLFAAVVVASFGFVHLRPGGARNLVARVGPACAAAAVVATDLNRTAASICWPWPSRRPTRGSRIPLDAHVAASGLRR
jgi:hypothetical protein